MKYTNLKKNEMTKKIKIDENMSMRKKIFEKVPIVEKYLLVFYLQIFKSYGGLGKLFL